MALCAKDSPLPTMVGGKPLQDFAMFILPVNNYDPSLTLSYPTRLVPLPHDSLLEAPSSAEPCLYNA